VLFLPQSLRDNRDIGVDIGIVPFFDFASNVERAFLDYLFKAGASVVLEWIQVDIMTYCNGIMDKDKRDMYSKYIFGFRGR
jgi:hypothetical protein